VKPLVIFTTFFDANWIIGQNKFVADTSLGITLVKLSKYKVFSIACRHPSLSKLHNIKHMELLSFLAPEYKWVHDYHIDNDWERYTKRYISQLRRVKKQVVEFLDNLQDDVVYFLCCWEDTTKQPHCHRQLVFDACIGSATVADKACYIYRDGAQAPGKRSSVHLSESIWGAIDQEIANMKAVAQVQYMVPGDNIYKEGLPVHDQDGRIIGEIASTQFEKVRNRTLVTIQLDQSKEAKKIAEQLKEPKHVSISTKGLWF